MSARPPLTVLRNGCVAHRTVRKTYGKKGKAPVALGTQNFFAMSDDLENKMARFNISDGIDSGEEKGQEGGRSTKEQDRSARPTKDKASTTTISQHDFDTASIAVKQPEYSDATKDQKAILSFLKDHSLHGVLSFKGYGEVISEKYTVEKIGEGSYSDVFALTSKKHSESSPSKKGQTTIIKLMPILLPSQGEVHGMTEPYHIASELRTMEAMDSIHGFIRYRGVLVVKGDWPRNFAQAFHRYAVKNKKNALNEDPATAFDSTQHFALIEMGDAGIEMNMIKRPSDFQIYDIFWSTCIHLANAESLVQFEHRDLHVSNICIKNTDPDDDSIDADDDVIEGMVEKPAIILGLSNISVTVIDYTYSRLIVPSKVNLDKIANYREFILETQDYDELSKLYSKTPIRSGNTFEDQLQNLTYAKAAKCVDVNYEEAEEERKVNRTDKSKPFAPWEHYVPKTNVCWLAYLITCLLQRAGKRANTKYVHGSNAMAKEVQDEIRGKLLALKTCLSEERLSHMPKSAADVVRIGVEKGWLTKAEIEAFKAKLEEDS